MKAFFGPSLLVLLPSLPLSAQPPPEPPKAPGGPAPEGGGESPAPDRKEDPRRRWLERLQEELRRRQPGGPDAPAPPGGEEGSEAEPPPADPLKTLEEAARLMAEAEEYLNSAAAWKGAARGTEAERKLRLPEEPAAPGGGAAGQAQEKQSQAHEKLGKLLDDADRRQKDTIERINLLIRQARACESQGGGSPRPQLRPQPLPRSPRPQPQDQRPDAGDRARRPYDPPPVSDRTAPPRTADRTDRWGDLPPHVRDEAFQGRRQVDEFPAEYRDLLQEYYKRLSGEE